MNRLLFAVFAVAVVAGPAAGQDAQQLEQLRLRAQQALNQLQIGIQTGVIGAPDVGFQPPRDTRPQTGTARIRGRVTTDSGQPLRRAAVRLNAVPGTVRSTTTDADGRFEFANLPAGSVNISVQKAGYVTPSNKGFSLTDGQRVDDVSIIVPKGAVITGLVLDEYGDPVISANVMPMRMQFAQGRRTLVPSGMAGTTNDVGEFRIFGLNAGQYYLGVTPQRFNTGLDNQMDDATGYATTYFPGTSDVAAAQRLTVGAGQTLSNVTFTLTPIRLAKITGSAFDADGRPLARGTVTATPRRQTAMMNASSGQIRGDGSFTISGVAPGDYVLRVPIAQPGPPTPGSIPGPPQFAIATVTVNTDVNGVALYVVKPVTVTGRVVFDDAAAAASLKPSAVRISAQPVNPQESIGVGGTPPVVHDDFTFELRASPGETILRTVVGAPGPPAANVPPAPIGAWLMKGLWVDGVNVIDTSIALQPGRDLSNVEIEMTSRTQSVSGTVTDGSGQPIGNVWVVAFSQDRDTWTSANNRYYASTRTGPLGRYRFTTLPGGNYYAVAVTSADDASGPGFLNDPDFLDRASRGATSFSLRDGAAVTVDLRPTAFSDR
jgi:hypothetical protein